MGKFDDFVCYLKEMEIQIEMKQFGQIKFSVWKIMKQMQIDNEVAHMILDRIESFKYYFFEEYFFISEKTVNKIVQEYSNNKQE
jgi:hypothetical protein